MIVNTMRTGVETYISNPDGYKPDEFPSRALVSQDIKNMFNAVSRQKLREIIRAEFPELAPFADCLYKET